MIKRLSVFSLLLLLAAILCSGCGGGIGSGFHGYEEVTLDELYDAYNANKLAAKDAYQGKYVSVSGILSYIDESGKYFRIDDGGFLTARVIQCNIVNNNVRGDITKVAKGDRVVVRGKIVDVRSSWTANYYMDAQHVDLDQPTEGEDASAQESGTTSENDEVQESDYEEDSDSIVLAANVPGEYGRDFTLYGGGSASDTSTRLGWFVPEGTYCVRRLSGSGPWEQVNYGLPTPTVNSDGFNESSQFECVLVKPDEESLIYVPEGGCVYITGSGGRIELTRQ